jgi:hypothetical protein
VIQRGEPWGSPASAPPDLEVAGGDAALAAAVAAAPGALVRFRPDATSDLARAVGLGAGDALGAPETPFGTALPLDVLSVGNATLACNMCIFGTPPDRLRWSSRALELQILLDGRPWFSGRATTVVIAIGQFLRGLDLVPRGHPGDGEAEIQLYELRRPERRRMRARLARGTHVPHPRIRQRRARTIELRSQPAARSEIDGTTRPAVTQLTTIEVVPAAYRLLV